MPDITELDPSELDTEDYSGMPDLCDSDPPDGAAEDRQTESYMFPHFHRFKKGEQVNICLSRRKDTTQM